MELDNFFQTAMNNVLKNPILSVIPDINVSMILKQSNFLKRIGNIIHAEIFKTFLTLSKF